MSWLYRRPYIIETIAVRKSRKLFLNRDRAGRPKSTTDLSKLGGENVREKKKKRNFLSTLLLAASLMIRERYCLDLRRFFFFVLLKLSILSSFWWCVHDNLCKDTWFYASETRSWISYRVFLSSYKLFNVNKTNLVYTQERERETTRARGDAIACHMAVETCLRNHIFIACSFQEFSNFNHFYFPIIRPLDFLHFKEAR